MILIRLVLLPPRLAFGTTRLTWKTMRLVGLRRLFWLGLGVGIGLLVAPVPGEQMRQRVKAWLDDLQGGVAGGPSDGDRYAATDAPPPVTAMAMSGNGSGQVSSESASPT